MIENELIVGNEQVKGENLMFLLPDNLVSLKFVENDIFDLATIKDCKVDLFTSKTLTYLFSCMKPGGIVEIIISQPIGVMQDYDSKQIKAHAEDIGFENLEINDTVYKEEKTGKQFPTLSVSFSKPTSKKKAQVEYIKEEKVTTTTTYKKKRRLK